MAEKRNVEEIESEAASEEHFDFPYLITDDWGRRWTLDYNNGDTARYTLDPEFNQKADMADSLSDGVVYLKKSDMANGQAAYRGRTFHW